MQRGEGILRYQRVALVCVAAILAIAGVIHLFSLNNRIAKLESSVRDKDRQIAALSKEHCSVFTEQKSSSNMVYTIKSSGGMRTYRVQTPAQYAYNTRMPMVILFSGKGANGAILEQLADFSTAPVISVYPEPLKGTDKANSWQGAPYSPPKVSDVSFTRDIITKMSEDYCVDPAQIYTVGMSNGGGMAWLSACYLSDKVAATATIAGAHYTDYQKCPTKRSPQGILAIHSRTDKQVPYEGDKKRGLPSLPTWAKTRALENGCKKTPSHQISRDFSIDTWSQCTGDTRVTLVSIGDQPHGWMKLPDVTTDPNLPNPNLSGYVWDFLRQYRR